MLATLNMRVFTSDRHLKSKKTVILWTQGVPGGNFHTLGHDRMAPLGRRKSVLKFSELSLPICVCFVFS